MALASASFAQRREPIWLMGSTLGVEQTRHAAAWMRPYSACTPADVFTSKSENFTVSDWNCSPAIAGETAHTQASNIAAEKANGIRFAILALEFMMISSVEWLETSHRLAGRCFVSRSSCLG